MRQFKAVQYHLEEKQSVQTLMIAASEAPTPDLTHGGPVFMSVGQVVELEVVGEKSSRRLEDEAAAEGQSASAEQPAEASASEPAASSAPADG